MNIFLILPLLLLPLVSLSQRSVDSLRRVALDETQPDSNRMNAYLNAAEHYSGRQPDSFRYFAEQLYAVAEAKGDNHYMASALDLFGMYASQIGDFSQAIDHYQRSMQLYQELADSFHVAQQMMSIGTIYSHQRNYASALDYLQQSLAVFREIDRPFGIAVTLSYIGDIYLMERDFTQALDSLHRSLEIIRTLDSLTEQEFAQSSSPAARDQRLAQPQTNRRLIASVLDQLGSVYEEQGNHAKSLDYYFRSLRIIETLDIPEETARIMNSIGNAYSSQEQYDQSLRYYHLSLEILERLDNKLLIAMSMANMTGDYLKNGDHQKALDFAKRGMALFDTLQFRAGVSSMFAAIGDVYKDQGDFTQALASYQRCLDIPDTRTTTLSKTHTSVGDIHYQREAYPLARTHGEQALQLAKEADDQEKAMEAAQLLYAVYKKMGRPTLALEMHESYVETREFLDRAENQQAIFQFEYQQKALQDSLAFVAQQAATELTYQQRLASRNYVLLGGLGLAMLIGLGFYVWQQRRLRERELVHQRELLSSTIVTQEKERQRIAKDLHDSVGAKLNIMNLFLHQLTRQSPEAKSDIQDMIGVIGDTLQTTRRISHDLLPPTLEKFGLSAALDELVDQMEQADGPQLELETEGQRPEGINPLVELHLFRIVQELLSNTLKHAHAQAVYIRLIQTPEKIILHYQDDGQGFDPQISANQRGLGTQNIQSRVQMIEGNIDLKSAPGQGIRVQLETTTFLQRI